ncbi:2,3,4,5-tetrahydropyridine-2,6-dicarboxylate N-succinyltransferase, partial [bacterium]|nr:2,3,4,5-tetrahydropyridine-2,6-dicarboxylate N-succinyltransferase [bacterium]
MANHFSFGIGIGTQNQAGDWLEVFYPKPLVQPSQAIINAAQAVTQTSGGQQSVAIDDQQLQSLASALREQNETEQAAIAEQCINSSRKAVVTLLEMDDKPSSVPEAYLKLHLLSHRLVKPHGLVLDGIFAVLPNVAWTNEGAIDLSELPSRQLEARTAGRWLNVKCVDKFPVMTDYVVPAGVRIAHTARVRLGAYIGEGTTIMHEGFVNFNAGTAGTSMIEGRISAGVFVGKGSDLGGGCSTMGTLSGGGNVVISVGEACLIGANAGIGIALGDRCTVEAGLYME